MEWLIGGMSVWIVYRFLTRSARSHRYFSQAIIWKGGGALGTGTRNIHKAVNLFKKASDLGHAHASFELGVIYENGWSHPASGRRDDQLERNKKLSNIYFQRCRNQSPDTYLILNNEKRKMQEDVGNYLKSILK